MTGGRGFMASEELQIVLEDVKEKFDTVMEGYNLLSEKIDRVAEELKGEIKELKKDVDEHRLNTEFSPRWAGSSWKPCGTKGAKGKITASSISPDLWERAHFLRAKIY
jgi:hypothetical protein